ncbi:hypothetical protein [Nonomuraea sp. NPDC049695]|uniref:hypothetical protein n=1 Tax=Nonomuraea sp. NPDC049695 TaxID=3154734 RepID=UPI003423E5B0
MMKSRNALAACAMTASALVAPVTAAAGPAGATPTARQATTETISSTVPCRHAKDPAGCHARKRTRHGGGGPGGHEDTAPWEVGGAGGPGAGPGGLEDGS